MTEGNRTPAKNVGAAERAKESVLPPRPGGAAALIGTVIGGRYRIDHLLGEGGMGAVYRAEHTLMHKALAVKILHPDMGRLPEVVSRFEREALAAARIDHPNVAAATDFGKLEDGSFFLVLELVEGKNLRDEVAKGPLEVSRALHILRQIVAALVRAHAFGIVHRDLKPDNVMLVERDGDLDFVKVLDFGIAKIPARELAAATSDEPPLTRLGMVYGTPEYMSPEQALGQEIDARADLYSVGVIAYELLAGARPFENEDKVSLLGMHITAPIPRIADKAPVGTRVPEEAEKVVNRLLSKHAKDRFLDAKDLARAIDVLTSSYTPFGLSALDGASTRGASGADEIHRSRRRIDVSHRTLQLGAIVILVVALGLGIAAVLLAVKPSQSVVSGDERTNRLPQALLQGELALRGAVAVHHALYEAAMESESPGRAMEEAMKWLEEDPAARANAKLLSDVRAVAALGKDGADDAFAILESKMGPLGPDTLYDLVYGRATNPGAAARAQKSLQRPEVQRNASDALAIALALRAGNSCEQKKAALPRAKDEGDGRALAILEGLTSTRGCGFVGSRDCLPCLHRDGTLAKTIASIRARLAHPG